jgi:hypothetical protein
VARLEERDEREPKAPEGAQVSLHERAAVFFELLGFQSRADEERELARRARRDVTERD